MFYLFLTLVISFLLNEFLGLEILEYIIGISSVIIIITTIKKAGSLYRWTGMVFLVVGIIAYLTSRPLEENFLLQFGSLTGLLSLLFVLPCLSLVINIGQYDKALGSLISRGEKSSATVLYKRTSLVSYMLTLFLNVATISVVVSAVENKIKNLKKEKIHQFFSHSLLRAYALVLLWSPTEILIAMSIDITGTSYVSLLPVLFLTSILFIGLDWFIHSRHYKGVTVGSLDVESPFSQHELLRKLVQMSIAITIFIILVIVFNTMNDQTFILTVTVLVVPFSIGWALFIRSGKKFKDQVIPYLKGNSERMPGIFFLFISAGFFVEIFPNTGVFESLELLLGSIYDQYSILIFFAIIGLFIFFLALFGFHPIISIALLTPFLSQAVNDYPYGLNFVLIGAGICAIMMGPLNIAPTLLAMILRVNPIGIIKRNLLFGFIFLLFNILLAYVFTMILY